MLSEFEKNLNAERKLQLLYWTVENLRANEEDEALLTTFNLIQNFCFADGMYKTLVDKWDTIEKENITDTEKLLPLYYGNMYK